MARAMKCDVCGGYYKPYNTTRSKYPNSIRLTSTDEEQWKSTIKHYDLCPDCLLAIALFIENLKDEKDDKVGIEMLRKSFNLPVVESVEGE